MLSPIRHHIQLQWRRFMAWIRGEKRQQLLPDALPLYLYVLPAHNGDTLVIQFVGTDGRNHYIWVDGGLVKSYELYGQKMLSAIHNRKEKIDLMVVTHVDQDHIGGILAFANDRTFPRDFVQEFWFNSGRLLANFFNTPQMESRDIGLMPEEGVRSIAQGIKLEDYLEATHSWRMEPIMRFHTYEMYGAALSVLAPDAPGLRALNEKWEEEEQVERAIENDYDQPLEVLANRPEREDNSVANGSSIGFVFEHQERRILLLGDAHPSVVTDSLKQLGYSIQEPLKLDCVKLSHHGSKASISRELLNHIDADTYVISTDGSRHNLPNKEACARILLHPHRDLQRKITFVFNYDNATLRSIFRPEEMEQYNFKCLFPPVGNEGYVMRWS